MLVKDVMVRGVITASPNITVAEAARMMTSNHVGSLVVMEKDKVAGIITDRDVLMAVAEGRKKMDELQAKTIMSKNIISVQADSQIKDAVEKMLDNDIKKLPVIDSGKLVGILTTSDIVIAQPKILEKIEKLIVKD